MSRYLRVALLLLCVLVAPLAQALPPDPVGRGLDVYVHSALKGAPGHPLGLGLRAYGFATIAKAAPLAGASLEVAWDPDDVADGARVIATADSEGRANVDIDVPPGPPGKLGLLVAVRYGGRARTHRLVVERGNAARIELLTADTRVVPTSTISAWVHVLGATGEPLAEAPVVVTLLEGGVARHREHLRTDAGGLVLARVPIPPVSEPIWSWVLTAELEKEGATASVELTPREEVPGQPRLDATWIDPDGGIAAGTRAPYVVRLRDATGQPLRQTPVEIWLGTRDVPKNDNDPAWSSAAHALTDADGEIHATYPTPPLVKTTGTQVTLLARVAVEGRMLAQRAELKVGVPTERATVQPEAPALVPGLAQPLALHVEHGAKEGIASTFTLSGDGLATTVTTDAHGDATFTWNVPAGVGARHEGSAACASDVSAQVKVSDPTHANRSFTVCVDVARDTAALVRATPNIISPGEPLHVVVTSAKPDGAPHSVVVRSGDQSFTGWVRPQPDGTSAADLVVPADAAAGSWDVFAAAGTNVVASRVVVRPRTLPLLTVKRTAGRAAPGGEIEVEAELTDGRGRGLPGAVSALVVDAFGGGHADVSGLDTRERLCDAAGAPDDQCTATLERTVTRSLGASFIDPVKPARDPGQRADADLENEFASVMRRLEAAVAASTANPDRLIDARRKDGGRWVFNPELVADLTEGVDEPTLMPGGESITLGDLAALDSQVTFDNVARRVTRLKVFTILSAVREARFAMHLDRDEPALADPNALVRRLVRDGSLFESELLDPWGGTIQWVKSGAPAMRFLGLAGFELRSPGPDGILGNADDVRDPFERVLRSGTLYARAMGEDEIVAARTELVVSDGTVEAWKTLLESLTGRPEGAHETKSPSLRQGMTSVTGRGAGYGGRASMGIANGDAYWTHPMRTDGSGRVRFTIPLGDAETTWRIAFVGVPDHLLPATASLDVTSDLPLSLRAETGARWVAGDVVDTEVLVRNRSASMLAVTVDASTSGAASLEGSARAAVNVPAKSAQTVRVRVRATAPGEGRVVLRAHADGVPDDVLTHAFEIAPAGEERAITQTAWVDRAASLAVTLDPGYALHGAPQLVLERGIDDALAAALDSLEPDEQVSVHGLLDSLDASTRIARFAASRNEKALETRATTQAERARGREHELLAHDLANQTQGASGWVLRMRERALVPPPPGTVLPVPDRCPPEMMDRAPNRLRRADEQEVLEVEPEEAFDQPPCWGAYVAMTSSALLVEPDPELVARGLLALAERPEHVAVAEKLALHLRQIVKVDKGGEVALPAAPPGDLAARATRTLVYAALLRTQHLASSPASAPALFGKIARLRDVRGGYGSPAATLAVVRALLAAPLAASNVPSRVHVRGGGVDRVVDVPASGHVTLPLAADARRVDIDVQGPGLVARLERPVLRSWTHLPAAQLSPIVVETSWPENAHAGGTGLLRLVVHQSSSSAPALVDARLPLPPGVSLAGPLGSSDAMAVQQLQGSLLVRQLVPSTGSVLEIPVRFGLGGQMSVPEVTARLTRSASGTAVAPARVLVVR